MTELAEALKPFLPVASSLLGVYVGYRLARRNSLDLIRHDQYAKLVVAQAAVWKLQEIRRLANDDAQLTAVRQDATEAFQRVALLGSERVLSASRDLGGYLSGLEDYRAGLRVDRPDGDFYDLFNALGRAAARDLGTRGFRQAPPPLSRR